MAEICAVSQDGSYRRFSLENQDDSTHENFGYKEFHWREDSRRVRRPVLKLAPQLCVDRCANASVNADGMAKFSINNFESGTLVGSSPPVLTVFQIGLQYLTTMDHRMKESFYD